MPEENAVHAGQNTSAQDDSGQEARGQDSADQELSGWLSAAGAPPAMAGRIVAELGSAAADRLRENPWLVLDVPGTGPAAADAVARSVLGADPDQGGTGQNGPDQDDPRRTRAVIGWLLRRAAHRGSTAHGADVLADELKQLSVTDPAGAIADAIETGQVHAFAEPVALDEFSDDAESEEFEELDNTDDDDPAALLTSARTMLCLERWAFVEQAAAEVVQRLFATPAPIEPEPAADTDLPLVAAVAQGGLTLATGVSAPGLAPVLAAFPDALVVTPGAAALRTLHAAGIPATDSRALAALEYSDLATTLADLPLLVVADAQLLNLEAGTLLLEATTEGTHVLLAGDPAALGSAEPGAMFRDLLEIEEPEFGGRLPRVVIKNRPTGPLSALADAVRHGGLPPIELLQGPDGNSKEVVIVAVKDPQEAIGRTLQLVADSIPRTFQFAGDQVQVVAPRADGPVGTIALNAALKARLNPGPGQCSGFDQGDRVVVSGPVPEVGLYGGETGTVIAADEDGLTVRLDQPHAVRRPVAARVSAPEKTDTEIEAGFEAEFEAEAESGGGGGLEVETAGAATAAAEAEAEATQAEAAVEAVPETEWRIARADAAGTLRHGWALTAREAQGGRWPAVVAVFDGGSAAGLTRALVLGMVSLATGHLSVVHGAGGMLAKAVETVPDLPRRTRLQFALRD
jgi:Helix-hairpin-helix containing domain